MGRKLNSNLGSKVDKAKKELAYDDRTSEAQKQANRKRVPKNFTIATENSDWLDELAYNLSSPKKRVSTSSVINAILDKVRTENIDKDDLEFTK